MKAAEARDTGRAAGTTLRLLTGTVRGIHGMVSDTAYAMVTAAVPAARPIKLVSDAITATAYGATGLGLEAAARAAGYATSVRLSRAGDVGASVHDGRGAHTALAASVGLRGDHLVTAAPTLAPQMQVRADGRRVDLTEEGLAEAFPQAGSDVAVFVHGLCQSESSWALGVGAGPTLPEGLATGLGLTPVLIRYNTGLRVSHNGAALAALLDELVAAWPVPVRRLVLVGFSMGGLVVHSALVASDPVTEAGAWRGLVTDSVTIGTPHHGSPMARGAQRAVARLGSGPHGRRMTDLVRQRSVGIKDLTHGNITEGDWRDHDPDDGRDHRTHPDVPDGIRHHAIVGVLGGRADSVVFQRVGDVMVPPASAAHAPLASVPSRIPSENAVIVTGVHHLGLLGHSEVHAHVHRFLTP